MLSEPVSTISQDERYCSTHKVTSLPMDHAEVPLAVSPERFHSEEGIVVGRAEIT